MQPFGFINRIKFKHKISGIVSKLATAKVILNGLLAYMSVIGIISFSLFIAQEGAQMCSFANFSASDTRRYDLMRANCDNISNILDGMVIVNKCLIILNPFQNWAYNSYIEATRGYVTTLEGEILANDPSVYIGEYKTITFKYNSFKKGKNGLWIAYNGKVKVILDDEPVTKSIKISGRLRADPDKAGAVILVAE